MKIPALPLEGGCRCGHVRLRVAQHPLLSMACHCTGCQRMSSSAYSLSLAVPTAGFEVLEGDTVIGGLRGEAHHHFCGYCMTWLFTRLDDMGFVNVRPTMLDDASWFVPFIDTWREERLPWAATPAVHRFDKVPDLADYDGLIAEFRTWSGASD